MWTDEERSILTQLGRELRARGWAEYVTVESLLTGWNDLALTANTYEASIDDYTNDLTGRDALEELVTACPAGSVRTKLVATLEAADGRYRADTDEDGGAALSRFFRFGDSAGWWWRRRPRSGPLATYLDNRSGE